MNERRAFLVALGLILLTSCRIPVNRPAEALVSSYQFEPEAFDSFVGVSRARYHLSQASRTSLSIVRLSDEGTRTLVITLFENLSETRGSHEHTWLGDTDQGTFAPSGTYIGVLRAGSEQYEAVVRVYHR